MSFWFSGVKVKGMVGLLVGVLRCWSEGERGFG